MALVLKDRVQETTTTSGTGTLTLSGAVVGFQTFSTAIGNGNTTYYTIYDNTAYVWEVGIGTVGAGTLARTTVLSNSSGGTSPLNLAGNAAFVFCTYPAERSINYDADNVATIGSTLGYTDTGIIASFASTVAGYNQVILQNKSTATNASTNFNVSNDAGTSGSNYAELGINSSTFTGSGSFNIAGASYVASASTDLTLGTYGAYSIHFVTNSSTTDAMTIFNNGGISLGGFSNPGIGNMAASKFVPGYISVTAAGGTTTLTASSDYYQNLVGTTTQTFKLPDATGLLEGTTFIFDNDSTGTLTVVDNASGSIETVPSGAASFVYLADNATVAGTWRRHAFLPASYDFNSSTANFGNATIINAVWNGTTIASGYGGTGLTSFTAANNALYSTSASALVAGTLPIAAGGTAKTTFTANGVVYGDGTNPLGVTAAGTTGQVLIATTGNAPSWGAIPTTAAVTSFQTSLSGLTPSTATTGAVTLAGTLGVTSGGTGQTTYTDGQLLIGNTTGNTLTKATLTQGTGITITNGSGAITVDNAGVTSFSAGTTGLTPNTGTTGAVTLAGTLGVSNGGTGQTTANSALNALLPSQTSNSGKYLTTDGTNSSWATVASGVTSFQTSLSGLTPSTATTGAVTLAGTLGVTSGGTGTSTAFTQGSIVFAGASGVYSQNNANLFWDNTNSRMTINGSIGIGATPSGNGLLELAAGTTTVAPLEFTSGTNLTTPVAGAVEYDGTIMTATSNTNFKRGTIPLTNYTSGTGITLGTNTEATLQRLLPAANDTITLSVGTYFFDTQYIVTRGASTTSATTRLNILGAGTAAGTFSAMGFSFINISGSPSGFAFNAVNINVTNVVSGASTTSGGLYYIQLRGILKITSSGTIIPQYNLSVNINGAGTVSNVWYFRLQQLDTQSAAAFGPAGTGWA